MLNVFHIILIIYFIKIIIMRISITVVLLLTVFCSFAQNIQMYVGTYTGTVSKGIYVYRFDAATGKSEVINSTDSSSNPSFLTISNDHKFLYCVNETHGDNPGRASAYALDVTSGKLMLLNSQVTKGDDPCYISVSKNNKWVITANYSGGNVSVFPVDGAGKLQPVSQLIQDTGSSIHKNQAKPHVHGAVISKDEKYVFTPDLGIDKIKIYKFKQDQPQPLVPANPSFVSTEPGTGPRHFTFHPNNKYAYLVEELKGSVSAYRYKKGHLKFFQRITTHADGFTGDAASADIHVSPDGRFLYASNRGEENDIAIYAIDKKGRLSSIGHQSTGGKTPRNFAIDPTGNYLLVANQNTDNIIIFKRDKATGLLQKTGEEISVPKPVCIKFISTDNTN
jgi:6-phosphogluconolactonase